MNLNLTFCNNECSKGQAAKEQFLANNNSAFDAIIDFWHFTDECFNTCPYKEQHNSDITSEESL